MNASDFTSKAAGALVPTLNGQVAFLPALLPPEVAYDSRVVLALSRADAALSELSGLGRHLPNPHLLIVPYTRREAVLSSRIEGTRASLSDVLRDEVEEEITNSTDEDVREVRNYVLALDHGIGRLATLPLSLRLVREMHEHLMAGVRGDQAHPGEFRLVQNWIAPAGASIEQAEYVPPPPDRLDELLANWERFLHVRDTMPDLVQCGIIHAQFETIHPFIDGNGRLGRLIVPLFLIERGRLSQPLLYLSAYLEAHRRDYYTLLQHIRTEGDWLGWLHFFLTGVTETATEAVKQASRLMDLRERYRLGLRNKPTAQALVDELFMNPYVTIARAAATLGVSHPAARAAVMLLQSQGILEEITGRSWGRIFLATPILDAIEEPPT